MIRGGFGGGGGRADAFHPQGFNPLPTQMVPLCIILRYPYLVMDPKIFLKAPLAPLYTNFEGGAEKVRFFVKYFHKVPRNAFFSFFFSKFCLRRRKFDQNSLCNALGELGNLIWSR